MLVKQGDFNKIPAYFLLFFQLFSILFFPLSHVAKAIENAEMAETIAGIQSLIDNDRKNNHSIVEQKHGYQDSFPENIKNNDNVENITKYLPNLGSTKILPEENNNEEKFASSFTLMGDILSSDNFVDNSINYAKSIGQGLVNQQINDWLNQYGKARISFSSDKNISGDFLLPVIDEPNNLLFTQLGLRNNTDRNTINLGLGYRKYWRNWMFGINTFYDYDYTGGNARLGVGGEAWIDYLKLAINGYFGLTDWHQSKISVMDDYDERPATGFDVRAEAYLPKYPQLGSSIKYEKYFGKGIHLGTGVNPEYLKDDAQSLIMGLNYTPIPLLTLKAERSIGDRNDTKISLDVNYRFGVPLSQQLNPDAVDVMRSLVGNKYDFVDRNYDIVMQYRKQDLLNIFLPREIVGEARDTHRINVTVNKTKYGLKNIKWIIDPKLIEDKGHFKQISQTEGIITFPIYNSLNEKNNLPAEYYISAIGTDNNGNESNKATTIIRVNRSTNDFSGDLTISPQSILLANDIEYYTVIAIVNDKNGSPLKNENIAFNISGLNLSNGQSGVTLFSGNDTDNKKLIVKTDSHGKASINVSSKAAGEGWITALMDNGNSKNAKIKFKANKETATIRAGKLEIIINNQVANGKNQNKVKAVVIDEYGNKVSGIYVGFTANNNAIPKKDEILTDVNGDAFFSVTNTKAESVKITAAANNSKSEADLTFIANTYTAEITEANLVIDPDNSPANGKAENVVTATVTDSEGNRVSNIDVTFTVSAGATIGPVTGKTDADGKATAKITSKKAGSYAVTATVNGKDTIKKTTFRGDKETAEITEANLVIDPDNSPANGKAENVVTATVTDSEGNRVSNIDVTFTVSAGATIGPVTGKTDADGKATAKITSKKAGSYAVTATVNGKDTIKKTTFRGDKETAEITKANLVIDPDNSPANGKAENVVTATVTDSEGNRVSNIDVTFTVSDGATIGPVTGKTDADGKATAKITSKKAGSYAVTATVNGKDTIKKTTFRGDKETAEITKANLVIDPDNSPANGKAENVVTATVTDSEGNRVSNIDVTFTVSAGATIEPVTGKTDADGKATAKITSKKAGSYAVTATVNGKDTTKKTTFRGDKETAEITEANLVIDPDNSPANGKAENVVTATVTDSEGNRVSNIDVTFTVSDGATIGPVTGKTDADGKATAKITSKKAGSYAVTATVNGKDTTKKTTFRSDKETAEITEANLVIDPDNSPANGKAENVVTATVTDSEGNRVSNIDVTFTVSAGATIEPVTGKTDADGKATAKITSKKAGSYAVTATVNGKDTTKKTTFRGDKETAEITEANLVIDPDNSPANGKAENVVTATVTDSEGNRVSNIDVTFTVSDGATIGPVTGKTDADGKATAKITSKKAGSYAVTATVNGKDTTKKTTFRGDKETAEITEANLVIDPDNSPANGKAENVVTATVTDSEGNRVSNIDVTFTVSAGATIEPVTGKTDADGKATAKITSKKAGSYAVTATVNGKDTIKKTTFRGDKETAEITEANLVIDPDNSPANGKAENVVTATVTDSEGNRVSNIDVTFTVSAGATIEPVTGKTDADGKATAKITSKKAGSYAVTATVNGKDTTKKTTFRSDKETAEITEANLVIDPDNSPANGKAENVVTATVTDSEGNRVSNIDVTFTVSAGATIEPVTGKTDADGKATAKITSKKAGSYAVTATVNGKDTTKKTTFRGDKETAEITEANLVIDPDNSPANGKAENVVTATVTDSEGNRVSNIDVTFTVSDGATIGPVTGKTDADGKATAKITSKKAGSYAVTATVNGKDTTKKTTFRGDKETAEITEANLVIDPDNSPANGKAENVVTATVTDSEGNRVSNIDVTFTVSAGATIEPVTGKTDADGKATAKITSKKAGSYAVTATVNGKDTTKKTTFRGDKETAEITEANLVIDPDNSPANGKAENVVTATVTDSEGNRVSNIDVTFTVSAGATIGPVTGKTDADGKATAKITSKKAGSYAVTATVNGKDTTKKTTFRGDKETAEITEANLVIDPDNSPANGKAENVVTATVTDSEGNRVSNIDVTFTVSAGATIEPVTGKTDADGKATAKITSKKAGSYAVTATVNGKDTIKKTTFRGDKETAEITEANLVIDPDNSPANGKAENVVTATVTDSEGNRVSNIDVTFTVSAGATIEPVTGKTDADGKATAKITSKKAGSYAVTATVNGKDTTKKTTFRGDKETAEITEANLVIDPDNSPANGKAENVVTATVTDSEGNRVSNIDVTFTVSDGATIEPVTGKTDADGKATAKITSKKAGSYTVTATVNGKDTTKKTTFRGDKETAEITEANLVIDPDNSPANGKAENVVTATVTDSEGNRVSNIDVTFTVSDGATIGPVTGKTDADGKATAKITSKKAGSYAVTATVNGKDTTKKTTFRGDKETAEITEANLVIDPDNSPANGKAENVVTATVTDSEGNRVSNIDVTFTVSAGATIEPVTGKTDADGKATAKITSKKAGSYAVTATVNGKDTIKKTTFRGDKETAEITEANLVIDPDNSPANGKAENVVTATVTDSEGNRVSNIDVTFTVSAGATIEPVTGKTDADGKATAKITSKKAGSYAVTATVNGKDTTKKTTFRSDKETAEITEANLVIDPDNSPANGKAENVVTATVTDSEGNRVSNIDVTFTVSDGATIEPVTGKTDADGKATAKITSKKAGSYTVTATVNGKDTINKTTFRGDKETAEINLEWINKKEPAVADKKEENEVKISVVDQYDNPIPFAKVHVNAPEISFQKDINTDINGIYNIKLKSDTFGEVKVNAKTESSSYEKSIKIIYIPNKFDLELNVNM